MFVMVFCVVIDILYKLIIYKFLSKYIKYYSIVLMVVVLGFGENGVLNILEIWKVGIIIILMELKMV